MLRRFITVLGALTTAILVMGVPLAFSQDRLVDDYWRDQQFQVTPAVADSLVDDYFRDPQPAIAPAVTDRIVDDYFRDPEPVAVSSDQGVDWGDFGIGLAVGVGSILMLVGIGIAALAVRSRNHKTRPAATA